MFIPPIQDPLTPYVDVHPADTSSRRYSQQRPNDSLRAAPTNADTDNNVLTTPYVLQHADTDNNVVAFVVFV